MIYCFDIDGTLCTQTDGNYDNAMPIQHRIDMVNSLYENGNTIYLLTARGMTRSKNNTAIAYGEMYSLTKEQLSKWGLKYHMLFLGKPKADYYIDDKAMIDTKFFHDGSSEAGS
jgi:hypothetical protein